MRELVWGINVDNDLKGEWIRKWGARAILKGVELLHDRQDFVEEGMVTPTDELDFQKWVDGTFLPALRKERFSSMENRIFRMESEDGRFVGVANPKSSGGYLYIGAGERRV